MQSYWMPSSVHSRTIHVVHSARRRRGKNEFLHLDRHLKFSKLTLQSHYQSENIEFVADESVDAQIHEISTTRSLRRLSRVKTDNFRARLIHRVLSRRVCIMFNNRLPQCDSLRPILKQKFRQEGIDPKYVDSLIDPKKI
jgi:hypothetical protein